MLKKNQKKSKNFGKLLVFLAFAIVFLDQIAKYFIKSNLAIGQSFQLTNFFSISHITNTGIGFGLLKNTNIYVIFISLIVVGFILFYWDRIKEKNAQIFFTLVISGIIGNLIDRIIYGHVVDFIYFSFWPAFNVADSAIVIGIFGLILFWKK